MTVWHGSHISPIKNKSLKTHTTVNCRLIGPDFQYIVLTQVILSEGETKWCGFANTLQLQYLHLACLARKATIKIQINRYQVLQMHTTVKRGLIDPHQHMTPTLWNHLSLSYSCDGSQSIDNNTCHSKPLTDRTGFVVQRFDAEATSVGFIFAWNNGIRVGARMENFETNNLWTSNGRMIRECVLSRGLQ